MTQKLREYILFIWFLILLGTGNTVYGDTLVSQEYAIKAAFIYNFSKFVEWPAETSEKSGNFIVCVLGDEHLVPYFEKLNGKKARDKKVVIRHIKQAEDIGNCHIVFVGKSEQKNLPEILTKLKGQSVLIVGDEEGFSKQGGMINFVMKDDQVRFEINPNAVKRAGLKISSKLLSLGIIVHSD